MRITHGAVHQTLLAWTALVMCVTASAANECPTKNSLPAGYALIEAGKLEVPRNSITGKSWSRSITSDKLIVRINSRGGDAVVSVMARHPRNPVPSCHSVVIVNEGFQRLVAIEAPRTAVVQIAAHPGTELDIELLGKQNKLPSAPVATERKYLEVWIRGFIPNPENSGSAASEISARPNKRDDSIISIDIPLVPAPLEPSFCFLTDNRGFSTDPNDSSRIETRFRITKISSDKYEVEPSSGRSKVASTTRIDCINGRLILVKDAKLDRDHIGTPVHSEGIVQVVGQVQGTNEVPPIKPSIDYSFDFKWSPASGRLDAAITHGKFPALEVYVRTERGSWKPVMLHRPTGSALNLMGDVFGNTERSTFAVDLSKP